MMHHGPQTGVCAVPIQTSANLVTPLRAEERQSRATLAHGSASILKASEKFWFSWTSRTSRTCGEAVTWRVITTESFGTTQT